MAEDKKIHEQPVPTVAKPTTPDRLQGAPTEPERELEQADEPEEEPGDHSAGGLIRQAWSLREGGGMHEVDTHGHTAPPAASVGASVARGDVGPMPPARRRAKGNEAKPTGARPEGAPPAPGSAKRR